MTKWFYLQDLLFLNNYNKYNEWGKRKIKRLLLLGEKVMTNLDSILKGRDITLPTNSI